MPKTTPNANHQREDSGNVHSSDAWPREAMATHRLEYYSRRGPIQTINRFFRRTDAFLMLAAVATVLPAQSAQHSIVTFDPPGALRTFVRGISPAGAITGYYIDGNRHQFGFLRTQDGKYTAFDSLPPGEELSAQPAGIAVNSEGEIAGNYGRFAGESDGIKYYMDASLLRRADGTVIGLVPSTSKG
jgi:hypothetical protein